MTKLGTYLRESGTLLISKVKGQGVKFLGEGIRHALRCPSFNNNSKFSLMKCYYLNFTRFRFNYCQETSRKKETCICLHNIHSKNNNIKWQQWRDGCTFLPGTLPILIGCLLCYPNIHLRESGECRKPRKSLLIQVNVEKFINFQLFETNCIDFKTCIPIIYRFKVFLNFQFRFPPMAMIFPSLFSVYSHIKGPIRALQVKLATTDLEWVLSRLTWIVIH